MNMYPIDPSRCWQDYETEYAMPVAAAAATSADMGPGPEPALILSLDEGSVECR